MRGQPQISLRYTLPMHSRADFLLEPDWLLPIAPAGIVHEGFSLAVAGA
jgi:hypothetical protein